MMAPEMFPPLVRSVTSAGEMSGQLGEIMERLASYLERSHSLQQKVRSALVYPALLGAMQDNRASVRDRMKDLALPCKRKRRQWRDYQQLV